MHQMTHSLIEMWKRINSTKNSSFVPLWRVWLKLSSFERNISAKVWWCKQIEIKRRRNTPLYMMNTPVEMTMEHASPKYPINVAEFHGKLWNGIKWKKWNKLITKTNTISKKMNHSHQSQLTMIQIALIATIARFPNRQRRHYESEHLRAQRDNCAV